MSLLLPSLALWLGAAQATPQPPPRAVEQVSRGVSRARHFSGWRSELKCDALQEAWCLVLEEHPEVFGMGDAELHTAVVSVSRRGGQNVQMPLESRLYELGIRARNTVLKDNHLNRQTGGQPVRFTPVEEDRGYQLTVTGRRTPPHKGEL